MRLINSDVEIWKQGYTLTDIYKHIERCGRVCYKSEGKITDDSYIKFCDMLKRSGHLSVFEHGTVYLKVPTAKIPAWFLSNPYSRILYDEYDCFIVTNMRVIIENALEWLLDYICEPLNPHVQRITAHFICDRGVSHEFVRHRKFSFSQESTRYCNYSKDKFNHELTYIIPSNVDIEPIRGSFMEIDNAWMKSHRNASTKEDSTMATFLGILSECEDYYFLLLDRGWKPQEARQVLPNALKTELVMTGLIYNWDEFFKLRASERAHPDAQKLAIKLQNIMYNAASSGI
jgi:thymidylate synthase (FAD)